MAMCPRQHKRDILAQTSRMRVLRCHAQRLSHGQALGYSSLQKMCPDIRCPDCGTPLKLKARASRSFRTLFGTFTLSSPRLEHCDCKPRKPSSFRPLSALLTESVAPELLYMEAKWSSLVSYGMSLDALKDFLPLEGILDVKTVRYDTLKVAQRIEAELGDEQQRFIEGEPSDWDLLPQPDGSFKVGIDGGYV